MNTEDNYKSWEKRGKIESNYTILLTQKVNMR